MQLEDGSDAKASGDFSAAPSNDIQTAPPLGGDCGAGFALARASACAATAFLKALLTLRKAL